MSTSSFACSSRITRAFLMLVLLLLAIPGSAQHQVTIAPRISYGFFRMQRVNAMQQGLTTNEDVPATITREFKGATVLPGFTIGYHFDKRFVVGLLFETGGLQGQVATTDPSEVYVLDHRIRYQSGGLYWQVRDQLGQVEFLAGVEAAYFGNQLVWRESDGTQSVTLDFVSPGMGLRPYAGVGLVVKRFRPGVRIGYQLYKSHPYQYDNPKSLVNGYPLQVSGVEVSPDWTGLRLNLTVGFLLFKE